jgi:6-pyruvoyltetrahydropterin/6-carboxytetrahydropterin synthase
MWKIEKKFTFEAAHRLPHHDGKCARLHGHSWRGAVVCEGSELQQSGPKQGMLLDFGFISDKVEKLVEESLDHYYLNESTGLSNPTCEEVARWIYRKLRPEVPMLSAIVIEETCSSRCEYRE